MRKILKERECKLFDEKKIFKPHGKELYKLDQITIFPDELEAMKLCDYDGYNQQEAGTIMKVSRGTIQRLLYSGRKKILLALLKEQAICLNNYEELKDEIFFEFEGIDIFRGEQKIAFPSSDGRTIEKHFGKASQFIVFHILDGKILNRYIIDLDISSKGRYPEILKNENITIVIVYGIGNRAIMLLNELKIYLKIGIYGDVDKIIFRILRGEENNDISNSSD